MHTLRHSFATHPHRAGFEKKGKIAYVEADYFGGQGFQNAIDWDTLPINRNLYLGGFQ